jgi:hypothetical protein
MTRKGAQMIIETLSLRVFEIQEMKERLTKEEEGHRARILELEQFQEPIQPQPIVSVG